jgi:hypothetical protein
LEQLWSYPCSSRMSPLNILYLKIGKFFGTRWIYFSCTIFKKIKKNNKAWDILNNREWGFCQSMQFWGWRTKTFFCLMFVYNLIISNIDVSHQQMCIIWTQIRHWFQVCQSNIEIMECTNDYLFYFQQYANNANVRILRGKLKKQLFVVVMGDLL